MSLSPPPSAGTYLGVQALRFVAAMLVVAAHATGMVSERILQLGSENYWHAGTAGVDIFFVISGFVMAISSRKLVGRDDAWKTFMKLRLVRIVPLYWLATTMKIALVLALPALALTTVLDARLILSSYFFIPMFNADNSLMFPALKVGWTLMYEMFFYLVFALALFLKRPALSTSAVLFVLLSIINYVAPEEWPLFHTFLGPLLLEFVMGMIVAEMAFRKFTVHPKLGVVLVLVAFAVIFATGDVLADWRWLVWGVPSMVIVGVTALCEEQIRRWLPTLIGTLGDSSYSLYLFHTFTVPLLGVILVKLHFESTVLAVLLCMIVSPITGLIMYKLVERPLTQVLKNGMARFSMTKRNA